MIKDYVHSKLANHMCAITQMVIFTSKWQWHVQYVCMKNIPDFLLFIFQSAIYGDIVKYSCCKN